MNGFLIIDKPAGVSSFDMVRQVRRLCHTRRVGHAGTLDPMATGVLPVAVGTSTRLLEYLLSGDKTYQATLQLGTITDTQDAEGQVLEERNWQGIEAADIKKAAAGFVGRIEQVPPMYSALKKDGQPLYKLARQGVEVERPPRAIEIKSLTIDEIALPFVTFTVHCSKGTYVRTICHDMGQKLFCGAHMTSLRRLACGQFDLSASQSPESLQALAERGEPIPLLTPAQALAEWQPLQVEGTVLQRLQNGVAPGMNELDSDDLSAGDRVKFLAGKTLVAIANYAPGGYGKRPGDFKILKVFPLEEDR
jgi:tRNA pseudouridine55 synthase